MRRTIGRHHENDVAKKILKIEEEQLTVLREIERELYPKRFPTHFTITQENPMIAIDAGNSPVFTATPTPAGSALPAGVVPTWTASDAAYALSVDSTGLICTVAIPTDAVVGEAVTLTVTATSVDGTQTASGTLTITVGAAPIAFPTGFSIAQSA